MVLMMRQMEGVGIDCHHYRLISLIDAHLQDLVKNGIFF